MSKKREILAEVAALEATLPPPSPTAHLPYVTSPADLGRVLGRGGSFLIGAEFFMSPRARQSLADIEALGG